MNESLLSVEDGFGLFFDLGIDLDVVVDFYFGGLAKDETSFEEGFVDVLRSALDFWFRHGLLIEKM